MNAAAPSPSTVIGPRVTPFATHSRSSSRESHTSGWSVVTRLGAVGPGITTGPGTSPQPVAAAVTITKARRYLLIGCPALPGNAKQGSRHRHPVPAKGDHDLHG